MRCSGAARHRAEPGAPPMQHSKLVAGDEQDHELRAALDSAPISFAGKLANSACHDRPMVLEGRAPLCIIGCFGCFEIRVEWRLDVDDEVALFRQANDHVGPDGAGFRRLMALSHEIAVLDHARELDEPAQRDLTPLAPHLGRRSALTRLRVSALNAC